MIVQTVALGAIRDTTHDWTSIAVQRTVNGTSPAGRSSITSARECFPMGHPLAGLWDNGITLFLPGLVMDADWVPSGSTVPLTVHFTSIQLSRPKTPSN